MAFNPATAQPLAFEPESAKPIEFDPTSAVEASFDPSSATEIQQEAPGRLKSALGSFARSAGRGVSDIPKSIAIERGETQQMLVSAFDAIDQGQEPGGIQSPAIRKYKGADPEERKQLRSEAESGADPKQYPSYKIGHDIDAFIADKTETNPKFEEEFWSGKVPSGLGSMVTYVATGVAAAVGARSGNLPVSPQLASGAAVGTQASKQASVTGFEDALNNGASLEDAYTSSNLNEVMGYSEAVPVARILDRIDKGSGGAIKRALIDAGKAGTEEAVQEATQTIYENIVASDLVGYDKERGVLAGSGEGGAVGFTTASLVQFLGSVIGGRRAGHVRPPTDVSGMDNVDAAKQPPELASEPEPSAPLTPEPINPADQTMPELELDQQLEALRRAEEPTLADIAETTDAELDAMVDQYLAEQPQETRMAEPRGEERRESPEKRERVEAIKKEVAEIGEAVARGENKSSELLVAAQRLQTELHTDDLTSLPNLMAFEEHVAKNPNDSVLFGDMDDFKKTNEEMGHKNADLALKEVAKVKAEVAKELGTQGYRRSGDEFLGTGADPALMEKYGQEVQKRLADTTLTVELPDGSTKQFTGFGFSYGVGLNEQEAETNAKRQKIQRREAGLREGTRDTQSVPAQPTEGQQDNRRADTQEPASDAGSQGVAFDPSTATIAADELISELESGKKSGPSKASKSASWIIREKATGKVVLETRDRKKVDALNTAKYEAVPIKEYLQQLNGPETYRQKAQKISPETKKGSGTLYANPIEPLYKAYQEFANNVLTRVHDAWGWKMTPLGKLPAQKLYLADRYLTLGKIADVEAISKRVYATFSKLDASEAEQVYQYLTTKDADITKVSSKPVSYKWKGGKTESTVRKQAEIIKRLIDKVGQNLVESGLLHKDSYQKYQDAYLPRLYLKHLLGKDAMRGFAGGKKPSDMGYLKERKEIDQDVRELILGEITDPGYLASKSLGKSMRDLAVLDWFEKISGNKQWALQDSLVRYNGKPVSVFWLKAEADRIREQLPYYKPENRQKADDILKQMDAVVQAGVEKLGAAPKDFQQVPDSAQYGRLRGMYIRKEIYSDIVGIPGNRDPNAEWWKAPFEYGGIGTKVTQLWKMSKVALNPPTQIRNFISNGILLQLSGVGSHRVIPLMVQSIQDMRQNGKYWRIAKKYGITASTFANNELYRIERSLLDYKARQAGKISPAQLKHIAGIIGEGAGDIYQLSEGVFKTAKIIDAMKREGMSETDAVLEAQKWLYDYSLVPETVRYFRNTPIGVPFLTFYYKTLPRIIEVLATAPHRFLPYVAIPPLLGASIASDYDVEPEDVEKLKLALPDWLRDHGHLFFLPFKDKHDRWQAFDFSYLLPWSMFEQAKNNLVEGQIGEAIQTTGVIGGPVPDMVSAIRTNVDSFTKKKIVDPSDPLEEQVKAIMNYVWSLAMPTWMTDNGAAVKTYEAISGKVDPRSGDPKLTTGQALLRFTGINIYPIEPEAARQKNMRFMAYEIEEIQRRLGQRMRDKNLTPADRVDIQKVYRVMIKEKVTELKEYREQSKIHPNLKGPKIADKAKDDETT